MLKIAVVGAGAIGGLIAARLSLSGQSVSLIARGETLRSLRTAGLKVVDQATGESAVARPHMCADASEAGEQDFVILAVKSYSLRDVARTLAPMLGAQTCVVTAVNGIPWWFGLGLEARGLNLRALDPEGEMAAAIANERVIGCVVNCAASVPEPGVICHSGGNKLTLGAALASTQARAEVLKGALVDAGFDALLSDTLHSDYWKKLMGNITLNSVGALTLSNTRQMLDDPAIADVLLNVMREVHALGTTLGLDPGVSPEERLVLARRLGDFRSSMLQDLEGGKPLEIEGLFAAVLTLAKQTLTPVPLTQFLYAMARRRAIATDQYTHA